MQQSLNLIFGAVQSLKGPSELRGPVFLIARVKSWIRYWLGPTLPPALANAAASMKGPGCLQWAPLGCMGPPLDKGGSKLTRLKAVLLAYKGPLRTCSGSKAVGALKRTLEGPS